MFQGDPQNNNVISVVVLCSIIFMDLLAFAFLAFISSQLRVRELLKSVHAETRYSLLQFSLWILLTLSRR